MFIVIEGLDGSGGETQSELLKNYFEKIGKSAEKITYPDYSNPIGKLIHDYLHRKYDFSVEVQFLLYFVDFIKDKEKIRKWLSEKKIVICDRYFTSTLAYQSLQGFSIEKALKIVELFNLPKPDLIIYLKISPDTSIKRKLNEKEKLDRNESNKEFLTRLSKFYEILTEKQLFGTWRIVDGEKSIGEVHKEIINLVTEFFKAEF